MPIEDELLERYGEFYCSEYAAKNQPWIRETPFEEWVERIERKRMRGGTQEWSTISDQRVSES